MTVTRWIVPALVVAAAASGVGGARLFAVPSYEHHYDAAVPAGGTRSVVFLVGGVRCVDTAERAARQLRDVPGVIRFTAWASRAKVAVEFDPGTTDAAALRDAIEGPVYDESTHEFLFGVYSVLEVDGVKVPEDADDVRPT